MSNETIGKFLLKVYEKTDDNEIGYFDKYKIGEEIGLLDKNQVDDVVKCLVKDGFINVDAGIPKIRITEEGIEQIRNNQI
jgi:predicted transcriptional regulator